MQSFLVCVRTIGFSFDACVQLTLACIIWRTSPDARLQLVLVRVYNSIWSWCVRAIVFCFGACAIGFGVYVQFILCLVRCVREFAFSCSECVQFVLVVTGACV